MVDTNLSILIVDDYTTMLKIVGSLLRRCGFADIDVAHDGPAALAKLGAKSYQLVISDWEMGSMSGLELMQRVRSDPRFNNIRFILMSADARHSERASAAGADGFLGKPFSADSLAAKIKQMFAGSHADESQRTD